MTESMKDDPQKTLTLELNLPIPEPKPFEVDPATSLLVVVDMQNVSCTPGFRSYNERMAASIPGNVRLLDKFRQAGAPVVFIQSVRNENDVDVLRHGRAPRLLEGSAEVEIVEALTPLPSEPVVQKWSQDPFTASLDQVLEELGADPMTWTVFVTGVATCTCHRATSYGFAHRHYLTVIPIDATASGNLEREARTFAGYMDPSYAYCMDFTTSELVSFAPAAVTAAIQA